MLPCCRHLVIGAAVLLALATAPAAQATPPADPAAPYPAPDAVTKALLQPPCEAPRYRVRHWLRERMVTPAALARYGLVLADDWQQADADRPVVVVIHGYNSSPEKIRALVERLQDAGYPCGLFAYPNDQPIRHSAQLLSVELGRFAEAYPERRVALVCHSMGGMVARQCIEDRLYNPGNVDRLIMIAPPSQGTLVAHFAIGTDLWEHWLARKEGGPWTRFRDSVVDGLGEAADDLCPDSDFLTELNAAPRNDRVHYSILLGTDAALTEPQLQWMRESICERLARVPGAGDSADKLDALLDDLDELVDGRGDGVVAVKRGRLDGVSDTVILPFGHLSVIGPPQENDAIRDVQQAVLERLQ